MAKNQTYPSGYLAGGRYRVGRLIGAGAMGEVYEAFDTKVEKQVALKLLTQQSADNPSLRKRFEREAKAAGRIGHDHVCDVSDWGVTDEGMPYLVMELLHGESLADRLRREPRLPVEPAVSIMLRVLSALEAAHAKGIIHRDLKPANIFLHRASDASERVKLVDFGIAKFLYSTGTGTQYGTVMGTLFYMSPEQAGGDTTGIDHRTDLWAASVILYQMIAGQHPFQRPSAGEVIAAIMGHSPPLLAQLDPTVPPQVSAAVARAMSKTPEDRFASAADFAAALRGEAIAEMALDTPTIPGFGRGYEAAPPVSRTLAAPSQSDVTVPPVATLPPGTPRRWRWVAVLALGVLLLAGGGGAAVFLYGAGRSGSAEPVAPRPVAAAAPAPPAASHHVPAVGAKVQELISPAAATAPEPPPVEIVLVGLPPEAHASFDGEPVAEGRFGGPTGRHGVLEVSAPDREPLRLDLTLDQNRELDLSGHFPPVATPAEPVATRGRDTPRSTAKRTSSGRRPGKRTAEGRGGTRVVLDYPGE